MWEVGLAGMFKDRDKPDLIGPCVGIVVSVEPLKVSILNGDVILQNEQLYICNHVLDTYKRDYEIEGDIEFADSNCGTTGPADGHSHGIATLNVSTEYRAEGEITFMDTLVVGDEVLVVPAEDEQMFFIIDLITKVGE